MNPIHWQVKTFSELSSEELYNLLQLRQEIFIVEQQCPYLDADGKDHIAHHLSASKEDRCIAYARMLPPKTYYEEASFGRFLTHLEFRGSGLGHELIKRTIEYIEKNFHTNHIRINAQQYLEDFYARWGFVRQGAPYLEDNIPHVEMLRN